ncbi:MAG: NAD(P)-dependent oxidoreductase [Bryobacteraceae bacterium]
MGVELVPFDEVFEQGDFVTINTFLSAETRGLVGARELRLMKPTAYLINTARGPIVQQTALVEALRENWIAGAGLDVFEQEPLAADDPIRELSNTILTPHGLAWTEEITRDNGLEACDNILSVARGVAPESTVNRAVIDRRGFQDKLARFRRQA